MKKKTLRILSLMLAVCMIVCTGITAFASEKKEKTVLVFVNGMGVSPLVENEGTDKERSVFPPETDAILQLVGEIVPPFLRYFGDGNADKLSDGALPAVEKLFEPIALNPDGSSKYNVTSRKTPGNIGNYPDMINENSTKSEWAILRKAAEELGEENVYDFSYDWRLDPMDHAKELNEYIKRAKEETGVDKVVLACGSMGGTITSSYLALYGDSDISHLIMLSSAFMGVSILGEMFCGNIQIDGTSLIRTLAQLDMDENLSNAIEVLLAALDNAGVLDGIISVADKYLATQKDRVYEEVFRDTFVTLTAFWDLVPLSYYENAKAYLLDSERDSQLIKRADDYHYNVQAKFPEIVKKAQKNGMMFSVVSHYNMQAIPVTPAYKNHADNLIDTVYTSGYATCAPIDETLPLDYEPKNPVCEKHSHISADRMIDASTCIAPDQTWFLKNLDHMGYKWDTEVMDFVMWLIKAEKQPTVFTNEKYPQFMETSMSEGKLKSVGTVELPTEPTTEESSTEEPAPETTAPETTDKTENEVTVTVTEEATDSAPIPETGDKSFAAAVALLVVCSIAAGVVSIKKKKE